MSTNFCRSDYLSWYIPRLRKHDQAINLHSSGVAAVVPSQLEISDTGNPYEAASLFEAGLACWLDMPVQELIFSPGATGGSLLALLALAGPGDELLIEQPVYEPMLRQAQRLGPVKRLVRRFEDGWRLPLGEARSLIGERTGLVMITEPHNPSGLVSAREDVEALARLAADNGALLAINEVYRGFGRTSSFHGLADNVVIVSSLSKLFGSYFARLGWISGAAELIERLRWGHLNMGMAAAPCAMAGLAFLKDADQRRERARSLAQDPIDEVQAWVEANHDLQWHRSQAPGFACVKLPAGVDDVRLAERLCDEHGVLLVPGTLFETPGTMRVSWLEAGERLEQGLALVAGALKTV
jgi:aspartate/methionine/tyrosine aminotransferase